MKRVDLEELLNEVLLGMAADIIKGGKQNATPPQIGGVVYNDAERKVGNAVHALAAASFRNSRPMLVNNPALVPPCF